MLPYWFSAMTMKSVGKAALAMVEEVRHQFNTIAGLMEGTAKPDYRRCVEISTAASLQEMVAPGALVMLSPVVAGVLFGTTTLAGTQGRRGQSAVLSRVLRIRQGESDACVSRRYSPVTTCRTPHHTCTLLNRSKICVTRLRI